MHEKKIHPDYHKIKVVMTDGSEFETKSTWGKENDVLKLDIDPKSHFAWTGGSQKILDKGRVSRYNKKFSNLNKKIIMQEYPFMPKATAVWLVENTNLTFKQIAQFCNLHELEVKGIADGDVAKGIKAYNPILAGQLSREEIDECSKNPERNLNLIKKDTNVQIKERKKPKYTPLSKRQDRPDAILWLCKNASELTDGQISKLVGSTKGTVSLIRKRSYWNFSNLKPRDPVILALCTKSHFKKAWDKAKRRVEREKKINKGREKAQKRNIGAIC